MKRVVVLGLMGQYPMGGMAWQVLHHVIGFRRLGCACFYVENSGAPPYSPRHGSVSDDARDNIRFLHDTFRRFDLADAWTYYDCLTDSWAGFGGARALELLENADLIVNLCGASHPGGLSRRKGCLVYLETDPVRMQVELDRGDPAARAFVAAHDVCFTYAWNLGAPGCRLPTGGVAWHKTHPPVLVDLWQSPPRPRSSWRTIATYRNEGRDVVIDGVTYCWSKHVHFDRLLPLPARTRETLEVALAAPGEPAVIPRFEQHGWRITDAQRISRTAASYRRYVQGAKGEFSVEKDQNVALRTGWFSDRTVCMLAAGRPCVIQDTGFGTRLPTDRGLLAWTTADEALDALERASRDYATHAAAALELAREHFDAAGLLTSLLSAGGLR